MSVTGNPRAQVVLHGASILLVSLLTGSVNAQTCPTGTSIPSFRHVGGSVGTPRQISYAWEAPLGAPQGTTYELLRAVAKDYCTPFSQFAVVAETTGTMFTTTLELPQHAYKFRVRVKGCESVEAPGVWVDDSYSVPPSAPSIAVSSLGSDRVMLTMTQNDARTAGRIIERATGNGPFEQVDSRYFVDLCPSGSAQNLMDAELAPGTYSYRASSFNHGSGQSTASDVVTIVVGGPSGVTPVIGSFSADPATLASGQPVTLKWSTTGATTVSLAPGIGPVPPTGTLVVNPTDSVTYTLTATNAIGSRSRQVDVALAQSPAPTTLASTLVTVVSSPGLYGAYFRTAIQLNNPSSALSLGHLVFHPREKRGSETDPVLRYALGPGETREIADVLALMGITGSGSLDIVSERGALPIARARVYNDGSVGTTGVSLDALPGADALGSGSKGVLLAPSDASKFRFSIGLRTLSAGAVVTFVLRDAGGTVVKTVEQSYPGTFSTQRVASELFEGATFTGNESVSVELSSGAAFVYATVADNTTNDPSIQMARQIR